MKNNLINISRSSIVVGESKFSRISWDKNDEIMKNESDNSRFSALFRKCLSLVD